MIYLDVLDKRVETWRNIEKISIKEQLEVNLLDLILLEKLLKKTNAEENKIQTLENLNKRFFINSRNKVEEKEEEIKDKFSNEYPYSKENPNKNSEIAKNESNSREANN